LRGSLPEFHSSRLEPRQERQGKGAVLARHDGDFRADAQEPLSLAELLAMLGEAAGAEARSREDAIACYLSSSEGWTDAVKLLGGTFAERASGLRERKAD
jgi:hypothetical protein